MLRKTLKLFAAVLVFSIIGVWISNNYGTVDITWIGYRMETSIPAMLFMAWMLFFAIDRASSLAWRIVRPFRKKKPKDGASSPFDGFSV
ncbi:MAG: hypothetical protein LBO78_01205 [Rickettsiales bacterium]|jgi:uncharacterized membrane-anchored protein|nr:hypothetical protein [Rickettsiales bacterium]